MWDRLAVQIALDDPCAGLAFPLVPGPEKGNPRAMQTARRSFLKNTAVIAGALALPVPSPDVAAAEPSRYVVLDATQPPETVLSEALKALSS